MVGTSLLKIAQVRHLLCSAVFRANATNVKTMAARISAEEAREKVLENDDELENMDLDIESEEIEGDAFENNNCLAETLKQSLQSLGKDLVNGEYFVNSTVEILVPLYDLIQNQVPGITQAAKILNSYPIYAGTIFYTESRLWLGSIYRRLAGRRRLRNRFYAEITRDIPYWIFSILLRIIKGIDGFCEPFVSFGRNKKAEVVFFTTLRPVKQLFSILSEMSEAEVVSYFKRTLTGKKCGSKVSVLASEEKDMAFMYKITKGQFVISYFFGEWNTHGFPQHN